MWKRKISIREQYGTLGHFLRGDEPCHYLGQRLIEGTNFYARREWRGVRDTTYAFVHWAKLWVTMAGLIARNPVRMAKAFWKYRWLAAYLGTPMMVDRWLDGDRGMTLRADTAAVECMVADTVSALWKMLRADRNLGETKWTDTTITFDYTLPKHIIYGFPGIEAMNIPQYCAFMMPLLRKQLGCYYIDQAISCGIPGEMCTLPLLETGVAVEDEYPDFGDCWLTTNTPCDANMMDNNAMWRAISNDGEKAVHPFTMPLMYDDPTTRELGVHEIYDAIEFLEQQLGRKFDWDAFKEGCEIWNEQNKAKFEKWDMNRTSIPPHTGASAWLYRIFEHQAVCGEQEALDNDRKVNKILEEQVAKGICPKEIRHRAIIWNTPCNNYANFNNWLLECWGIDSVCEMIDLHGSELIDTSTHETMLYGLAKMYQTSTMRAHTKGGYEVMYDDLWRKYEEFHGDMIIMFDQISCKGVGAISGLFEEGARQRGIKMCIVRQDLMDPTSISRKDMRRDVNVFMQNVMGEEPLDPTLVDFDDDLSW